MHTKKPALPASFYEPSIVWTSLNILYGLTLFVIFSWLNYQTVLQDWNVLIKTALIIPFSLFSAIGLYVLAALGHDALHGNLCKNERLSLLIGLFFSSSVLTYIDMGFVVRHWTHHRHTNRVEDPDIYPTAMLNTWWQRLGLSRVLFNLVYLKNAFYMAIGRLDYVKQYKTPLSDGDLILFSRLNFLFAGLWIAAYVLITIADWRAGLFGILIPMLFLALLAGCQSYLDHAGLDDGQFANAYSRTSFFMSVIYFGSNYHLEHHLYPKVPGYRLPKVHKILLESGIYEANDAPIVNGFFEAYKTLWIASSPLARRTPPSRSPQGASDKQDSRPADQPAS